MAATESFKKPSLPGWVTCAFDSKRVETDFGGEIESPDTPFPIASVTKTLTAHLCLQDSCRKLIDQPIVEMMPYFQLQDVRATREMTPRDALCHFSGLAPHTPDWVRCELSRKDYIATRLPLLPSAGSFREKHRYSNLLYAVLGQWLEEVSGKSWETLITGEILDPLQMHDSALIDETWSQKAPAPYRKTAEGGWERIPPFFAKSNHLIAPASEILASVPDLARWGQFMLTLPPGDERWKGHSLIKEGLDYGLGWRIDSEKGEKRVWHSGQCSGYTSLLCLWPEKKTGFAAATNLRDAVYALNAMKG